ncbi:nucleoporin complex subunit 54-domain-containing protein [Mycotypha africana]|uniref:nucleoporin complex subunit 54-domain-containing protein n=1 Tax=Mycotypha africana TaxID=64632 RepID=UPI0023002E44|nr:nucleoporin complex subunit 54-domain-containing protein [Mycotypha africana]KAI8979710.1 nucleoporin complex subunit 54-domain-containing protein [Mycotypha africana]
MSFGGFGSSTSAFGSNTTQSAAGTLFGGTPTASSQPANTSGLFGSTTANNSSAGTLFGSNNTVNSASAGTLFGGSATATSAPASTVEVGTNAFTFVGFGVFGSTPAFNTGTGTFGASASSTAPTFGGLNTTSQPTSSAFSLNTSALGTSNNSGFGTTTNNTIGTNTAGGFGGLGSSINTNTGFGASTATTGFGGFGSNNATTTNKTGFGTFGSSNNLLNTQNNVTSFNLQQQQQQQQQPGVSQQKENVWQEFALIKARFDPTSPLCQFRHYFYNKVPPNEVQLYVRPPNQDEQLWNEACRKNPDPTSLVPVLAVGFDDILKRIETQQKQSKVFENTLLQIAERVSMLRRKQDLGTKIRLEEHKRRHMDLRQRVLRLLRYSQVLRYKGFPLTAEEESAMEELNKMATENYNPEDLASRLNILWAQIQSIREQRSAKQQNEVEVWRTVSEEDTNAIAKLLEDEQNGIKHITNVIKEDEKELETMEAELKERIKQKTRR